MGHALAVRIEIEKASENHLLVLNTIQNRNRNLVCSKNHSLSSVSFQNKKEQAQDFAVLDCCGISDPVIQAISLGFSDEVLLSSDFVWRLTVLLSPIMKTQFFRKENVFPIFCREGIFSFG